MSLLYRFNRFDIVFTENHFHLCKKDRLEIFSLARKGISFGNLISKLVYTILYIFSSPEVRGEVKISKTLELDEIYGKLYFKWYRYINTNEPSFTK